MFKISIIFRYFAFGSAWQGRGEQAQNGCKMQVIYIKKSYKIYCLKNKQHGKGLVKSEKTIFINRSYPQLNHNIILKKSLTKDLPYISILSYKLLIYNDKNLYPWIINSFNKYYSKKLSTGYPQKNISKCNSSSLAFIHKYLIINIKE